MRKRQGDTHLVAAGELLSSLGPEISERREKPTRRHGNKQTSHLHVNKNKYTRTCSSRLEIN